MMSKYHNVISRPIKRDIRLGRDSGYWWCCISFYLFRNFFWRLFPKYFDRAWERKQVGWLKKTGWQHVSCPMCTLLFRKRRKPYHVCLECGWTQYRKKDCNNCKKHHVHGFAIEKRDRARALVNHARRLANLPRVK